MEFVRFALKVAVVITVVHYTVKVVDSVVDDLFSV